MTVKENKDRSLLNKMKTTLKTPVSYDLTLGNETHTMTQYLHHTIHISFTGRIYCNSCEKQTKKSFMQGFCYRCMLKAPEASECIIRPELCQAHKGIGRDPEWEDRYHNQPHYVYLAKSSAIKVGVTRDTQVPYRWIDQGATEAIPIAKTPNRYLAGCIEVALKTVYTDRTHWQKMLKNVITDDSLQTHYQAIENHLSNTHKSYYLPSETHTSITYPVEHYPTKIKSLNLDKTPTYTGTLVGIKGQYLIFKDDTVFNVRKFTGYEIEFNIE